MAITTLNSDERPHNLEMAGLAASFVQRKWHLPPWQAVGMGSGPMRWRQRGRLRQPWPFRKIPRKFSK